MADAKQAVDFVMRQEDETLSGVVTDIPGDQGGMTRFGLSSKWHPELVAAGFYDPKIIFGSAAVLIAEQTYEDVYEDPLYLEQINDQAIATALLSFAVNEGNSHAIVTLQQSTISLGAAIADDGRMGPMTVAAINACGPARLLSLYCATQSGYYEELAVRDPTQQKFLKGWLSRVNAVQELSV